MLTAIATAVRDRLAAPPIAPGETVARDTLVVVGNGMVGHRLCRRLIDLGAAERYRIVVFGEEPEPAYDRVHLTDLFDTQTADQLCLAPASWYERHEIELYLGDPVVEIDRQERRVRSASGLDIGFSHLVLATGSSAYVPPIEGVGQSRVFVYRTMRDLRLIHAQAQAAHSAAVIGGGLLGLEAARALQRRGLAVTVVESAAALMPAQLDQAAGEELGRQVAALGIEVLTATMTRRIKSEGRRRTLHFATGGGLTVDMVVVAAGIRPRSQLAAACGLATSRDGGIVVSDTLRTSDPRISAIGECVSHRSKLYGFVAPGYSMADALARRLTGQPGEFEGFAPTARLKLLHTDVCSAGEPLEHGAALTFRSAGVYRRLRLERGRLVGALGVGEWPEFSRIQDATSRRALVWPWQAARFERTGVVWRPRPPRAVAEWPSDTIVCNCLGVTRGQIAAACVSGAATVETVIEHTSASTLCGSCRPLLTQVIGVAGPLESRVTWGLLGVSIVAMAIAVAVALSSPIPYATSVQGPLHPDVLWRNGGYRQVSGFVLVGLSLAASLLSIRKRWRRFSVGRFPMWRVAHALVGLITLAALVAHTGMRAGDNLNFALMTSFVAVNVLGAAGGGLTAIERWRGGGGRRARAAIVAAHVLATWPLPMLIAFHVASAYYF